MVTEVWWFQSLMGSSTRKIKSDKTPFTGGVGEKNIVLISYQTDSILMTFWLMWLFCRKTSIIISKMTGLLKNKVSLTILEECLKTKLARYIGNNKQLESVSEFHSIKSKLEHWISTFLLILMVSISMENGTTEYSFSHWLKLYKFVGKTSDIINKFKGNLSQIL